MSKDKMNLFAEGFKGIPERLDAALINFTKSMNEAAKALNDFRTKSNDIKCDSEGENENSKS